MVIGADRLGFSRKGIRILDKASFGVEEGRILAVAGPADGGQHVLMQLLAGLARPSEGALTILGADAYRLPAVLAAERCCVIRGVDLPAKVSVERLMALQGDVSPRFDEAFMRSMCGGAGIATQTACERLAPAQRLLVLTALTLASCAKVQIFDGPGIGLPPEERHAVYTLLRDRIAQTGATAVVAVDSTVELDALADDVLVLARGRTMVHLPMSAVTQEVREVELPPDGQFAETMPFRVLAARWSTGRRMAWVHCPKGEDSIRDTLDDAVVIRRVDLNQLYHALTGVPAAGEWQAEP